MLTSKQKQYLKALASKMPAVLQIGKEGNTESVLKSAEDALLAREFIKVKTIKLMLGIICLLPIKY